MALFLVCRVQNIANAITDVFKNVVGNTPTPIVTLATPPLRPVLTRTPLVSPTPSPEEEEEDTLAPVTDEVTPEPVTTAPSLSFTPAVVVPAAPSILPRNNSTGVEASVQGATSSAGTLKQADHQTITVSTIAGAFVGAVAVGLMIAAFTLWYKRFKRRVSFIESITSNTKPPTRPVRTFPKDVATAGAGPATDDFSTRDSMPMLNDDLGSVDSMHMLNNDFVTVDSTRMLNNDFSTMDSTRVRNNRTDPFVTAASTYNTNSQSGSWDDPTIVANKVPLEKVETQALISRGGYGEVYRGVYKGQTVAIKKLLPATRKDLKHIEAFFGEVKLMIALEHTRIVTFIGVAWDSLSDVCVLSEFMDGGDLRTLLMRFEVQERRPRGLDYDKVQIALHVVHALTYLHCLVPIVLHRDLKSKNILLDSQLNAKLTDFGVSRAQSDATMTAGVGTSLWMAPEVMLGENYDEKSDIFSFGVVLSELDSHLLPYSQVRHAESGQKLTDTAILQLVSSGRLQVEFSEDVLPELQELGEACVALDPRDRPTAAQVLYRLQLALKKL